MKRGQVPHPAVSALCHGQDTGVVPPPKVDGLRVGDVNDDDHLYPRSHFSTFISHVRACHMQTASAHVTHRRTRKRIHARAQTCAWASAL